MGTRSLHVLGKLIVVSVLTGALGTVWAPRAEAATIMLSTSSSLGVFGGLSVAAGFNLTDLFNNVTITMDLASNNGSGSSVTAFLTTQIGPGTNAAHNVVPSAVIPVPSGLGTQVLFSGLTLGPGAYFFSILPADGLTGLLGGGTGIVTTGAGVTNLGLFTLAGGAPAGTPAAITFGLRFSVTGDPVSAAVPEPGTFGLLAGGILILALRRRRVPPSRSA